MSWHRKDDGLRLYLERSPKTYLLVDFSLKCPSGSYECIGDVYTDPDPNNPALASCSCDPLYLYRRCRRVAWVDLPKVWQDAFLKWLVGTPESHRGLHRMPTR